LVDTKVFFATDVHGSELCFKKFLSAKKFYQADVLILGGDMTGKIVVPIIRQPDGTFKCRYLGRQLTLKNRADLDRIETGIRMNGYYPYHTDPSEAEDLGKDKAKMNTLFRRLMLDTLQRWIGIAEERFRDTSEKIYITGGNDDPYEIEPILNKSNVITNPEGKVIRIDDQHEMLSSGHSNITPWGCPRDISEEELETKITSMLSQVQDMKNCIFNLHVPPYGTGIDTAYELEVHGDEVVQVMRDGKPHEIPVGSKSVRNAIEKSQPLLGLHGHIHESRGICKVGRTLCVNPGSEYSEGVLRGALITVGDGRIKDYMLTSG